MITTHVDQVGGDHYQARYQHWDYAAQTRLPYLEGCASKYVGRWKKKGGKVDLEKALSYVQKVAALGLPPAGGRPGQSPQLLHKWLKEAGLLGSPEGALCVLIDSWRTDGDLQRIMDELDRMITDAG